MVLPLNMSRSAAETGAENNSTEAAIAIQRFSNGDSSMLRKAQLQTSQIASSGQFRRTHAGGDALCDHQGEGEPPCATNSITGRRFRAAANSSGSPSQRREPITSMWQDEKAVWRSWNACSMAHA